MWSRLDDFQALVKRGFQLILWLKKVFLKSCTAEMSSERLSAPCIFIGQDIKHFYKKSPFSPIVILAIISRQNTFDKEFVIANNIAHVFYDEIGYYLSVVMIRECFKLCETKMLTCIQHCPKIFTNFIGHQLSSESNKKGGRLVYLALEDIFFEDQSKEDLEGSTMEEVVVATNQECTSQAA